MHVCPFDNGADIFASCYQHAHLAHPRHWKCVAQEALKLFSESDFDDLVECCYTLIHTFSYIYSVFMPYAHALLV